MKHFKLIVLMSAFVLISTVAWAGSPEFDAAGNDAENYYAATNGIYRAVTERGHTNQWDSFFIEEGFHGSAGAPALSPCSVEFGENEIEPMYAVLTDQWNEGFYTWQIVLQMKPETDLNLNIYDCVLAHYDWRSSYLFNDATQTGRVRDMWGMPFYSAAYQPLISAFATPGPYNTPGFIGPMRLDARTLPGLVRVPLTLSPYTSKAHWPEGIIIAKPQTGELDAEGVVQFDLKQGDTIHIRVDIIGGNTADVWYGRDSVLLKYVGLLDTNLR